MKFHYFSQLLVDSNCLLLILKMFGMQEVSTLVRIRHEKPDHKYARTGALPAFMHSLLTHAVPVQLLQVLPRPLASQRF